MTFDKWQKEFIGGRPFYNGNTLWQKEAWEAGRNDLAEQIRDWIAKLNVDEEDYDVYPEDISKLMAILAAR